MPKHLIEMTPAEIAENRRRIARGLPPDFEADQHGKQTAVSVARDQQRRAAAEQRAAAAINRQYAKEPAQ